MTETWTDELPTVGIVCDDLEALRERCLVSGVELLYPTEAAAMGYKANFDSGLPVIVPTEPREPTPDELHAIVATEDTTYPIQLVQLPPRLAETVYNMWLPDRGLPIIDKDPYDMRWLVSHKLKGRPLDVRDDWADALTVSIDAGMPLVPSAGHLPWVGMHIDAWPQPQHRHVPYFIANLGPGPRYHLLSPDISRTSLGDLPPREVRAATLAAVADMLANGCSPLVYWLRTDPPGNYQGIRPPDFGPYEDDVLIEALVNLPPFEFIHDGSMRGLRSLGSMAIIGSMEPVRPGVLPSPIYQSHSVQARLLRTQMRLGEL